MGQLNWLDIAAIVIIGVFALDGLAKGLVLSFFNIAGFFAAYLAARNVSGPIVKYICTNTGIDETLNMWLAERTLRVNHYASSTFKTLGIGHGGSIVSQMLMLTVTFILVFVCVRILITMFANGINIAARLPVVKQFNSLGGLFFGILKGALLLYIIFALMTPVIPFMGPSNLFVTALSKSRFAVNFYTYNFIIPWIQGII